MGGYDSLLQGLRKHEEQLVLLGRYDCHLCLVLMGLSQLACLRVMALSLCSMTPAVTYCLSKVGRLVFVKIAVDELLRLDAAAWWEPQASVSVWQVRQVVETDSAVRLV